MNTKEKFLAASVLGAVLISTSCPSFAETFCQKHPHRTEVLGRDANLNRKINRDYGHLSGNYGKLERQDASIRRQEQRDARNNGGYITKGQQQQLNREENRVNREIRHDYNPNQ